jgi:YVTN family beta-propeller protein
VIDTTTNTVSATVGVGTDPFSLAITPDGTKVYVGNNSGDSVSVIDTNTNVVSATVPAVDSPNEIAITPDGTRAYVTNALTGSITVIDTATNLVTATVPVGVNPVGIAFTPDGTHAYMVDDGGNNAVLAIDIATNLVSATVPVGSSPEHIAITPTLAPPIVEIACSGFRPPFDKPLSLKKNVKRAIPVDIDLTDVDGYTVTDSEITAPPVINVLFGAQVFGEIPQDTDDLLPLGSSNEDNIFRYDSSSEQWVYNLGTKQFQAPGTYMVTVTSGDADEYKIAPTCTQTFERLP